VRYEAMLEIVFASQSPEYKLGSRLTSCMNYTLMRYCIVDPEFWMGREEFEGFEIKKIQCKKSCVKTCHNDVVILHPV
jgi:hypothetical protein